MYIKKYDLQSLLDEIKEDETFLAVEKKSISLSQSSIQDLIKDRKKKAHKEDLSR